MNRRRQLRDRFNLGRVPLNAITPFQVLDSFFYWLLCAFMRRTKHVDSRSPYHAECLKVYVLTSRNDRYQAPLPHQGSVEGFQRSFMLQPSMEVVCAVELTPSQCNVPLDVDKSFVPAVGLTGDEDEDRYGVSNCGLRSTTSCIQVINDTPVYLASEF